MEKHVENVVDIGASEAKRVKRAPSEWTVEQVIKEIVMEDGTMQNYSEVFRKHVSFCLKNFSRSVWDKVYPILVPD